MKGVTLEFILCALAVGLSVWAVIEARNARAGLDNDAAGLGLHRYVYGLRDRLSALESRVNEIANAIDPIHERINKVEDALPVGAAWPAVLRTPSADRPEVKNVTTDEAGH